MFDWLLWPMLCFEELRVSLTRKGLPELRGQALLCLRAIDKKSV